MKKLFIQEQLLSWYTGNARDFPWRRGKATNYQIIISEILLQRTKAETVARFFPLFFSRFPDWESLCEANLEDVETFLKPLGLYKQRSQRIHSLAMELQARGFSLPSTRGEAHEAGLSGLYVANAFELFVLKKRSALLDVNMARILSRYFESTQLQDLRIDKDLQELSLEITNVWNCKELNWAFLDFAAMVCTARKPACKRCPLRSRCSHHNYETDNYVETIDNKKVNIKLIRQKRKQSSEKKR